MKKIMSIFLMMILSTAAVFAEGEATIYGDRNIKSGKVYKIRNLSNGMCLGLDDGKIEDGNGITIVNEEEGTPIQINIEEVMKDGSIKVSMVLHEDGYYIALNAHEGDKYVIGRFKGIQGELFTLMQQGNENKYKIMDKENRSVSLGELGVKSGEGDQWAFEEVGDKKSHREIIAHWAPDIYQDFNTVNDEFYNYDYITNFNFDGDWNGFNNWENSAKEEFREKGRYAYVYASIQETPTHYFLTYNFFHPRDVGGTHIAVYAIDSHENDLEGALYAVKKDGSPYGKVELIYTQAHGKHDTYKGGDIKFRGGDESSGKVELFSSSNGTALGTHGHSVHMWKEQYPGGIKYINTFTQGDGDIGEAGLANFNPDEDNVYKECQYKIISLDEIWNRRYDIGSGKTFKGFGSFGSDASGFKDHLGQTMKGSANAPWSWDNGLWISDPAFFMDHNDHFDKLNHRYTFNKYTTHNIIVDKMKANVYKDPAINSKKRADIFIRVQANGTKYIDIGDYKKSNVDIGKWHDFYFGGEEAEGDAKYTEKINGIFITKNKGTQIIYEMRDRDTGNDDSMGIVQFQPGEDESIEFEEDTSNRDGTIKGELHIR